MEALVARLGREFTVVLDGETFCDSSGTSFAAPTN
jgi:hypothetical protein